MKIQELTIYTKNLSEQLNFYSKVLKLPVSNQSNLSFSVQIGYSTLIFQFRDFTTPYHFAINIPSNQENEALEWLKKKVAILKDNEDEIIDFKNWNAKAIYFYDTDNNIIEFIARKNLKTVNQGGFDQNSLTSISEIGVPVSDIQTVYLKLNESVPFEIYDGSFERFCAIGDENGLFIVINKNAKDWFPTNDKAFSSDFRVKIKVQNKQLSYSFENGILI